MKRFDKVTHSTESDRDGCSEYWDQTDETPDGEYVRYSDAAEQLARAKTCIENTMAIENNLREELVRVQLQCEQFRLRIKADTQYHESLKSHGVPDWYSHNWPKVFFMDGNWFGVHADWVLNPGEDWKGFPTVTLGREDGAFICHGTFAGDWRESLTERPAEFVRTPTSGNWVNADEINQLVRRLDVALNGEGAAPQATLCDIVAQVEAAPTVYGEFIKEVREARRLWLDAYPTEDGADCVTPFDQFLYVDRCPSHEGEQL